MSDTPIQFGATAPAVPPTEETPTIADAAANLNSAVNLAEQEAEGEVETAQAEVHTHETILSGFFTELEGFQNMGKAEVYAVIQRWHGKYKAL